MMLCSWWHSARRVLEATLLVAMLSVAANSECLAEDFAEQEVLISEEPPVDPLDETLNRDVSPRASSSSIPWNSDTAAATFVGALGGLLPGGLAGVGGCIVLCGFVHDSVDFPEINNWGGAGVALGGILGGYWGYQNYPTLIVGGASSGALLVALLGDPYGIPIALIPIAAFAGGGLGYALWNSRRDAMRWNQLVSVFPYRDQERSGVLLSGRF